MSETNQTGQGEPANNPNGETGQVQTQNNNTGQTQTPGNGQTNNHKNVSWEDFNDLRGSVSQILNYVSGTGNGNNQPKGKGGNDTKPNVHTNNNDGNSGDGNNNNFDITKNPQFQQMQQELEAMKNEKNTSSLKSVALSEAKSKGIKIDGMVDSLIGKDEKTTKELVGKMADTIKSNQSTQGGFNVSSISGKNIEDRFKKALDRKYGK